MVSNHHPSTGHPGTRETVPFSKNTLFHRSRYKIERVLYWTKKVLIRFSYNKYGIILVHIKTTLAPDSGRPQTSHQPISISPWITPEPEIRPIFSSLALITTNRVACPTLWWLGHLSHQPDLLIQLLLSITISRQELQPGSEAQLNRAQILWASMPAR